MDWGHRAPPRVLKLVPEHTYDFVNEEFFVLQNNFPINKLNNCSEDEGAL